MNKTEHYKGRCIFKEDGKESEQCPLYKQKGKCSFVRIDKMCTKWSFMSADITSAGHGNRKGIAHNIKSR